MQRRQAEKMTSFRVRCNILFRPGRTEKFPIDDGCIIDCMAHLRSPSIELGNLAEDVNLRCASGVRGVGITFARPGPVGDAA